MCARRDMNRFFMFLYPDIRTQTKHHIMHVANARSHTRTKNIETHTPSVHKCSVSRTPNPAVLCKILIGNCARTRLSLCIFVTLLRVTPGKHTENWVSLPNNKDFLRAHIVPKNSFLFRNLSCRRNSFHRKCAWKQYHSSLPMEI